MRKLVALLLLTCAAALAGSTFKSSGPAAHGSQATISFIGVSAESESNAASDLTLNAPGSPQIDDIWIAVVGSGDQATNSLSGWTQITEFGSNASVGAWWYRYDGNTPNLVVTAAGSSSNGRTGAIAVFRNCKRTGSPVNVLGSQTQDLAGDTSIEISGITPTAPGCMLVAVDASRDDQARSPIPSGFTAAFEDSTAGTQNCFYNNTQTNDVSAALFYKQHTSGATGDFTDTQAGSAVWVSVLFALEPQ